MTIHSSTYLVTNLFFVERRNVAPGRIPSCRAAAPLGRMQDGDGSGSFEKSARLACKTMIISHSWRIFKPDHFFHTIRRCLSLRRRGRFLYTQSWPLPQAGRSRCSRSAA
ncbi:MAG: hypothetical protein LBG96_16085 [Tannerella sp.]|nr:hypothetical protein [Tannerella sp.]